ncbi:hypothetical protein U1Q18_014243 [Sarracenia purpurea var. burkii]
MPLATVAATTAITTCPSSSLPVCDQNNNQNPLFTFSSLSSVDQMNIDPSLIFTSFRSSDAYNFTERLISMEGTTNFAAVFPATTVGTIDSDHPWQIPTMVATNYWDDIDSLVSTNYWDDFFFGVLFLDLVL